MKTIKRFLALLACALLIAFNLSIFPVSAAIVTDESDSQVTIWYNNTQSTLDNYPIEDYIKGYWELTDSGFKAYPNYRADNISGLSIEGSENHQSWVGTVSGNPASTCSIDITNVPERFQLGDQLRIHLSCDASDGAYSSSLAVKYNIDDIELTDAEDASHTKYYVPVTWMVYDKYSSQNLTWYNDGTIIMNIQMCSPVPDNPAYKMYSSFDKDICFDTSLPQAKGGNLSNTTGRTYFYEGKVGDTLTLIYAVEWQSHYSAFNYYTYQFCEGTMTTPIIQNETTYASATEGEDGGAWIDPGIVDGNDGSFFNPIIDITLGVGGAGLIGIAAAQAINNAQKKKKNKRYKMYINKNFGDQLKQGMNPQPVFARIVEVDENGMETPCPELTSQIQVFSGDNHLAVSDGGMTANGYKTAYAQVPDGNQFPEGQVSFRYVGVGGTFTQNVIFQLGEAKIIFAQENLGIAANKGGEYRIPFAVGGMGDNVSVTLRLEKVGTTDSGENRVELDGDDPKKPALAVRLEPSANNSKVFEAVISEIMNNKLPAGTTEAYKLIVTAENGSPDSQFYEKKEVLFPVYRIHLGLELLIQKTGIGCYLQYKPGREGVKKPKPEDFEPCITEGSLILFDYDEKNCRLLRIAVAPDMPDEEKGIPSGTKVIAKKLLMDRYAHKSDADQSHQDLVDKLGITAFPTADIRSNGARRIKICSTKGSMDPPTRMIADLEITVTYKEKKYTVKQEVLLRSQPFRVAQTTEEQNQFIKRDAHIKEQLANIRSKIYQNYMNRLYSLHDLIDRMLDGFDERFGFDERQVKKVMEIWTDFLQGKNVGAGAEPEGVTFADELKAAYAFMQGLRDNTGFLGRVAMGVMTSGYSEYVFSTMTLAENIEAKVYAVKPGDPEFGFWDAVEMGVKEFGMQIVSEYAIRSMASSTRYVVGHSTGYDVFQIAEQAAQKYRSTMDSIDRSLCKNSKVYNAGAQALKKAQNYFNSLSKGAKAGIEESVSRSEQATAKADQRIAAKKKQLTPAELKAVEEYDLAMQDGLRKVKELKDAQQSLAKAKGAEKELARKRYRNAANEVWNDKNAIKQLQRSNDPYAKNMRYEFNQYREGAINRAELRSLDEIAADHGIPREELYVSNATGRTNRSPYEVPGDRDTTINRIVKSDRTKDFAIDQRWGEDAMARNLYRELNGVDPPSIEAAREFMHAKDVTYVCPEGSYYMNHVIEPNLEAYTDLSGMLRNQDQALKGLVMNQKTIAHKGKEWFTRDANKSLAKAAECERAAANLTGSMREAKLLEARSWRYKAQGQKVEGIRQITKQFDNIIDVRNSYKVGRGYDSAISDQVREIHAVAKRVETGLSPAEFEKILREDFGLTLDSYADLMSKCLV